MTRRKLLSTTPGFVLSLAAGAALAERGENQAHGASNGPQKGTQTADGMGLMGREAVRQEHRKKQRESGSGGTVGKPSDHPGDRESTGNQGGL